MDNSPKKDHPSAGNHGPRGVWARGSSTNRRPPFAGPRSVPLWEKKFCESIGLIPWHKLLEAKKLMYLYKDVVSWNDTAAEEAFNNAKSRFWAEMNGLPCNIQLPDPDIYIDKVDWNTSIDPELLLDLERGPDVQSKSHGAEGDSVVQGMPFMLESEPFLCSSGWGDLDEVPVPVLPTGSAEPQGWVNWNETTNNFSCNDDANQRGAWNVQGDLNRSKGWNNWDDDNGGNNYYASKCNWEEGGKKDSWNEANYGNCNLARGRSDPWRGRSNQGHPNQWRRRDGGGYEGGVRASEPRADRKVPMATHDDYRPYRGFPNNRGRARQERSQWADRKPSYGRW